jgi:PAS domain S-box-containing protein
VHPILKRQLKQAGIGDASAPPADAWSAFLEGLERAFRQVDQDRYLVERSLSLSSEEMQELHVQLAAERDAVKAVVRSLAEGVCALDQDGILMQINPEAARLLRLHQATAVGKRLAELVEARDEAGRPLAEVLASPPPADAEHRLIVAANPGLFITCTVRFLPGERPGKLLTLRDISERKRMEAEREAMNNRLLDLNRRAGMAEIASGVLHNVGNALNSVNVSASVAGEAVRKSRLPGLARAAKVLEQNQGTLGEFLSGAGRELPAYLGALAEELALEQKTITDELTSLTRHINHIRRIVDTQQEFARVSGLQEDADLKDLISQSLNVASASLERHGVRVELQLCETPAIRVDSHQVIQILVNFLTNAKHALTPRDREDRRLTVATNLTERPGFVRITVTDNGVGIAPEALSKIFTYGYTTRKGGHGFGLHSAALSAKVMGGEVSAHSDGPGKGARFTLDIPVGAGKSAS